MLAVKALALALVVRADLPVSCLHEQLVGHWNYNFGIYDGPNCGWSTPDRPGTHKHVTPGEDDPDSEYFMDKKFQPLVKMDAVLLDWHVQVEDITDMQGKKLSDETLASYGMDRFALGEWTMIYNQGIGMSFQGDSLSPTQQMYSHMKYKAPQADLFSTDVVKNMKYSYCDYTLLGPWNVFSPYGFGQPSSTLPITQNLKGKSMCFWGKRIGDIPETFVPRMRHRATVELIDKTMVGNPELAEITQKEKELANDLTKQADVLARLNTEMTRLRNDLKVKREQLEEKIDKENALTAASHSDALDKAVDAGEKEKLEKAETGRNAAMEEQRKQKKEEVVRQLADLNRQKDQLLNLQKNVASMTIKQETRVKGLAEKKGAENIQEKEIANKLAKMAAQQSPGTAEGPSSTSSSSVTSFFRTAVPFILFALSLVLIFLGSYQMYALKRAEARRQEQLSRATRDGRSAGRSEGRNASREVGVTVGNEDEGEDGEDPSDGDSPVNSPLVGPGEDPENEQQRLIPEDGARSPQQSGWWLGSRVNSGSPSKQKIMDDKAKWRAIIFLGLCLLAAGNFIFFCMPPHPASSFDDASTALPKTADMAASPQPDTAGSEVLRSVASHRQMLDSDGNKPELSPETLKADMQLSIQTDQLKTVETQIKDLQNVLKQIEAGESVSYTTASMQPQGAMGKVEDAIVGPANHEAPMTPELKQAMDDVKNLSDEVKEDETKIADNEKQATEVRLSIGEAHKRALAKHQQLIDAKKKVRYNLMNEKQLKQLLAARSRQIGIELTEHSDVELLLSRKAVNTAETVPGLYGFSSSQNVGPSSDHADKELGVLAQKLGVSPGQLSLQVIKELWGPRAREDMSFFAEGRQYFMDSEVGPIDGTADFRKQHLIDSLKSENAGRGEGPVIKEAEKTTEENTLLKPGEKPKSEDKAAADKKGKEEIVMEDNAIAPSIKKRLLPIKPQSFQDFDSTFDLRRVVMRIPNVATGRFEYYKDFTIPAMEQGNCGNCYAAAASNMYTSRLMYKYPDIQGRWKPRHEAGERLFLSLDQQTKCSSYNQGCDGGYPWLSHMWSSTHDLVTNTCWNNLAGTSGDKCMNIAAHRDYQENHECDHLHFRVMNWRYIGSALGRCGYYGVCEQLIREEVFKGGAITTAMEPAHEDWGAFSSYSSGILHETAEADLEEGAMYIRHPDNKKPDCKKTTCYTFRKLDHALLVVGWSVDTSEMECMYKSGQNDGLGSCKNYHNGDACNANEKCHWGGYPYWTFQNSWGEGYGEKGFLHLGPRGQNPWNTEAMATVADVVWIDMAHVDTSTEISHRVDEGDGKAHGENAIVHHGDHDADR